MTREEIITQLRIDNPTSTLEDGRTVTTGAPEYKALIERWADAMEAQTAADLAANRAALTLTRAQFGELLIRHGLKKPVLAALAAVKDPTERDILQEWFEYTPVVRRTHPKVEAFLETLGISPDAADALFAEARAY